MATDIVGIRAAIEVRDVAASIAFYRRALGLEPVTTMGEPPTFAILAGGGGSLAMAEAEHPAVAAIAAVYVEVADVEAAFARCTDAGFTVTTPLTTHPWQMRDFVIRDRDGHQIAVGQRVEAG
jgi:catechol 2,3-dioxygenase-like lactoylglutathione lyase family enzyme